MMAGEIEDVDAEVRSGDVRIESRLTDGLELDVLLDMLEEWRHVWQEANVRSQALMADARAIVARKPSDPHVALAELIDVCAGLHPDVIAITLASLEGAIRTVERTARWRATHGDTNHADVIETMNWFDRRLATVEEMIRGIGALASTVGRTRPS